MGELLSIIKTGLETEQSAIAGLKEPVVSEYFQTLNAGNFTATSQLFAVDGALQPPFEEVVIGPEAIAAYLEQEARGIELQPQQAESTLLNNGCTEVEVVGKVHTPWFSVNVCWMFILSPTKEIFLVKVELLAGLQDLLQMRNNKNNKQAAEL
ncbi:NTF2 domain protein [Leptolyngbyaceae cyanobacterium JSC-12]|nr:NTF2 domain protein [Leptolyngbyaceae cyanobacterium JSC-12]